jgi:hypothetical protein
MLNVFKIAWIIAVQKGFQDCQGSMNMASQRGRTERSLAGLVSALYRIRLMLVGTFEQDLKHPSDLWFLWARTTNTFIQLYC